jgi:hypothetical protein
MPWASEATPTTWANARKSGGALGGQHVIAQQKRSLFFRPIGVAREKWLTQEAASTLSSEPSQTTTAGITIEAGPTP